MKLSFHKSISTYDKYIKKIHYRLKMNRFKKAIKKRWYNYFKEKGYNDEEINTFLLNGYRKCEYCGEWTNTKKGHHYLHQKCIESFYNNNQKEKRKKLLKSLTNYEKELLLSNQCKCSVCGKIFNLSDNLIKYKTNKIFICSDSCLKIHYKQRSPISKEYWLKRGYSEEEAMAKISEIQKIRSPISKEYWLKRGYSEEEAMAKISEIQQKRSNINVLNTRGKPADRTKIPFCKEYYTNNGYSEEEAIKLRDEYIKYMNSKEHLIEKYGEEKGLELYNKLQLQNKNNFSKQYYIEKYGEEKGIIEWSKKYQYSQGSSKVANKIFKELYNHLNIDLKVYSHSISEKEFGRYINNNLYVFYDFVIPELKICIEYNGDYWHCNPQKYDAEYYHKQRKLYAKEIWELDEIKKQALVSDGYDYFVIWDSDIGRKCQMLDKIVSKYTSIILDKWRLNNVENKKNS